MSMLWNEQKTYAKMSFPLSYGRRWKTKSHMYINLYPIVKSTESIDNLTPLIQLYTVCINVFKCFFLLRMYYLTLHLYKGRYSVW